MTNHINRLHKALLNTVFPATCDFCQKKLWVGDDLSVCHACKHSILPNSITALCFRCAHPLVENICPSCSISPSEISHHTTVFFYSGLGKDLMQGYKFHKRKSYVETLVDLIIMTKKNFLKRFDIIVPVTIAKRDYFDRDFCPVLSVCKKVVKKVKLKIVIPIVKIPQEKAQHHKTREERKNEVSKQYKVLPPKMKALQNKRILIIDDIFTTGATLNVFYEKIKEHASTKDIQTFTFARSIFEE